jgi:hypothetical protein
MIRRTVAMVVLVVGLLATGGPIVAGEEAYTVDDEHELADTTAVAEYEERGSVSGEIEGLDATLSVAKDKEAVDRDGVRPLDVGHDYIRLEYREDIARTLRIWIPASYTTPYVRDGVSAIGSDHTASYQPVRDGQYLQVVIEVDGSTDVVLPIHKHSSATYSVLGKYEERFNKLTGADREWRYLETRRLEEEHAVEVPVENPEDVVVHYDATPNEPEETWVNAPRGDGDEVYWYAPDSENGTVYVVSRADEAPSVRIMQGGGWREEVEGHINDARQIPDRLREGLESPLESLF